jgi:hypothetical protein
MRTSPYSLAILRITITRPGMRWTLHRAWMREWMG